MEPAMSANAKGSDVSRKVSLSDPGPENKVLLRENPSSNDPPPTDRGNPGPLWYSFDLAPKRVEAGGWTHQVTQRELPSSTDLAGVNMRLTAGSFRELHWHKANEWAIMLTGKARVSLLQVDGKMFIDDVEPAISGTSRQVCRTRSRDWGTMAASSCWFSIRAISRKTIHCWSRNSWRIPRRSWCGRIPAGPASRSTSFQRT